MFVNRWKVASAARFQRELGRDIWQRSFYDHVLRPRESLDPFAWYIWMNPVREGLCQDPHEYPWSGSATMKWMQAETPAQNWTPPVEAKQECGKGCSSSQLNSRLNL